ncbi:uncharacterized protein LOC105391874 [Plutella xylostella]|uniref:uncharacterized protein LOC105391874 n=1 Tax=Plutella xylostella TaxID=51655 RepID=UPI0020331007|nr:uncharacterized protein LOC105391874 [Plutella xylostella]
MGICLDTEQNNEEAESAGTERGDSAWERATPPAAAFPMQNNTHVKFEPPSVPVIFVLGGPGSGKVTHCDNLMQERRGVVHINMTDLLQQYAIGNDMQDFGTLSSKTVTEVLMLEMKMAPAAKTYLVSGYPRSMRDVAEYSDKIQTISGVVLVSWRQRVLERQIEYGARLGHVVLSLARMELKNFYKNVMPVAEYFDQSNMLIAVNGERNPEEVYKDFRAAILQVLGAVEEQSNGGVGAGGIPGEIVGVEPAPPNMMPRSLPQEPSALPVPVAEPLSLPAPVSVEPTRTVTPKASVIRVRGAATTPPLLFVVGGPGSNKAALCQRAAPLRQGWTHFSLGQRLRAFADAGGGLGSDGALARAAVSGGSLAPRDLVSKLVRAAVTDSGRSGHGLVLDSYPRDLEQLEAFEKEYRIQPRMVLLDCSKLQLGRGRRDDSVGAFRRRLEVFREMSLPMLKSLDTQHRLVIVDGDTDTAEVQEQFSRVLLEEMEKAEALANMPAPPAENNTSMSSMQQFANAMSRMGGALLGGANGVPSGAPNGNVGNGYVKGNEVKPMVNNNAPAKIPTVSQMTHEQVRKMYEQSSGDIAMNSHI